MKFVCFTRKFICVIVALVCACVFVFTGCIRNNNIDDTKDNTLVVSCDKFTGVFNPLYSCSSSDMTVCDFTQEYLFNLDRNGEIVNLGIQGENKIYNGTDYTYHGIADCNVEYTDLEVNYHIKLREDICFSDGEKLNADDVIFTMYAMSDPCYNGIQLFSTLPIVGMKEYKYGASCVSEISENDLYEKCMIDAWKAGLDLIVEYCSNNYPDLLEMFDNNKISLAMYGWGFADYDENIGLKGKSTGKIWSLADGNYPTEDDLFEESRILYNEDADEFYTKALTNLSSKSIAMMANELYAEQTGDISARYVSGGATNIAGIVKTGEYSLTVKMYEFSAVSMYALAFNVLPLHYYGDENLYDYDADKFGFVKGDLSGIKSKNQYPLGAGPYSFEEYSDGVVTLKRNTHYYKGCPKIENILLRETNADDNVDLILTDVTDVAVLNYNSLELDRISKANSNGDISGDVIYTVKSEVRSYGYIGINADNVKVGNDKSCEESKALRSAFATIFAVYRDVAISSYFNSAFGCLAKVIEYPIQPSSWSSPKSTDEGYSIAFSRDVSGNELYSDNMDESEKYEKALSAAKEFFIKAGYSFNESTGVFDAAPNGASLEYTIVIPGGGTKAHPAYIIASLASEALEDIGITLVVKDVSGSNIMWDLLADGECEMWAAAWGRGADPNLIQFYHSQNIPGKGGSDCNYYGIEDSRLDKLMVDGNGIDDIGFRKKTYRECYDIIMDWAVEVPVFAVDSMTAFCAKDIDVDTITPDITAFWSWQNDIEKLEMKR